MMKTLLLSVAVLFCMQAAAQKALPMALRLEVDSCIRNNTSLIEAGDKFTLRLTDRPSLLPLYNYNGKNMAIQLFKKTVQEAGRGKTMIRYVFTEYVGRRVNTQLAASDFKSLEELGQTQVITAPGFSMRFRLEEVKPGFKSNFVGQ